MQRLEVSCAVRRIYTSLGAKGSRVLIDQQLRDAEGDRDVSLCKDRAI